VQSVNRYRFEERRRESSEQKSLWEISIFRSFSSFDEFTERLFLENRDTPKNVGICDGILRVEFNNIWIFPCVII